METGDLGTLLFRHLAPPPPIGFNLRNIKKKGKMKVDHRNTWGMLEFKQIQIAGCQNKGPCRHGPDHPC